MKLEKAFYVEFMKRDTYSIRQEIIGHVNLTDEEVKKIHGKNVNTKIIFEVEEPILDEEERKYLSGVIRPFRDRIKYIKKLNEHYIGDEYILIKTDSNVTPLPYFKAGTMYKGMELNKEYTLEELGL